MLILDLDLSQGKHYVLLCSQCCMKKLTNVFYVTRAVRITSLPEIRLLLLPYVRVQLALINMQFPL